MPPDNVPLKTSSVANGTAHQIKEIPVDQIDPRPDQPRKNFPPDPLLDLGKNMLAVGQLVPIIVYFLASSGRYVLVDGERRWRAAQLVGIKTLLAWVLDHAPTTLELHRIQMCIAVHNVTLSVIEKAEHLRQIKEENNLSVTQLAEHVNLSQPQVSKLLSFTNASPELRAALQNSSIDQDRATTIASEPDHDRQRELLKIAADLSREQLRQKARSGGQPVELRASVARFPLPNGGILTVQGRRLALSDVIGLLQGTIKELKRGQEEGWDLPTAQKIFKNRAQASK